MAAGATTWTKALSSVPFDACNTTYVYCDPMQEIRIEWDPRKAAENRRKHGVSFSEAESVFADENALLMDDPFHSDGEDRFLLLGLSSGLRILVVVHCYREEDAVIRLISARRANAHERRQYDERLSR